MPDNARVDESEKLRPIDPESGIEGGPGPCPFCFRIVSHAYDAGDEWSVTFEPLNPVTSGHRLFVPRAHVANAAEWPEATGRVMKYAAQWASGHDVYPFNLITSAGKAATQSVFHLHVHLVPRREDDGLALPWSA